jgi:general secretion pathway protein F
MPFFQFEGRDATGKIVSGSMQCGSQSELTAILKRSQIDLVRVNGNQVGPAIPAPPVSQPRASSPPLTNQQPVQQTKQQNPQGQRQSAQARPAPQPSGSATDVVYTKPAQDRHRFLLFTQLAALFRTGHSANTAFDHVAGQSLDRFRISYPWIIQQTSQGGSLATAMAKYPDLYPRSVTETVRVGEVSGNLPEALDLVANQAEQAHRYKKWHWWLWVVLINALLSIPGMILATRGMLHAWDRIDSTGGTGKDGNAMSMGEASKQTFSGLGDALVGRWGFATLVFFLICTGLYYYYKSRQARAIRHKLGATFPFVSKRAKHENIERFSWSLGKMMKSGASPATSWEMASRSVPNDHFYNLLSEGNIMIKENVRLSQILGQNKVFSDEMSALVSVAEQTGDFAGALEQSRKFAEGEKGAAENYAKLRVGGFGCLGCFVTSGIMLAILMYAWFHELPAKVLSGMDP